MSDTSAKVDVSGSHTTKIVLAKGGYGYAETSQIYVPNMSDYTVNITAATIFTDSGTVNLMNLPEFNVSLDTDGFMISVHNQTHCGYSGSVHYTLTKK